MAFFPVLVAMGMMFLFCSNGVKRGPSDISRIFAQALSVIWIKPSPVTNGPSGPVTT